MKPPATGRRVFAAEVVRTFRGRDGAVVRAVDGVSLELAPGSFTVVSGPSGCGKSTLLALLSVLDRPDSGEILHDDTDVTTARPDRLEALRRGTGFVFQAAPMLARVPVWENVTQALVPLGVPARERRDLAAEVLDRLGIGALAGRAPEELSGGERQRAALARAIVHRPRFLVADEPTSQLDADAAACVVEVLRDAAARGATVLAASHDDDVVRAGDRVLRMRAGQLV